MLRSFICANYGATSATSHSRYIGTVDLEAICCGMMKRSGKKFGREYPFEVFSEKFEETVRGASERHRIVG
jgi:hypothetical protein